MKDSGFEAKIDLYSNTGALALVSDIMSFKYPSGAPGELCKPLCVFVGEMGSFIRLIWVFVYGGPDI